MKEDVCKNKKALVELRKKSSDEEWDAQGHRGDFIWNVVHAIVFLVAFLLFIYGFLHDLL